MVSEIIIALNPTAWHIIVSDALNRNDKCYKFENIYNDFYQAH